MPDMNDLVAGLDSILESLTKPAHSKSLKHEGLFGPCESVAELAAVNRCSELKATMYAVQRLEGAVYDDAVEYIKALVPSPPSNKTGVTLMLVPDFNTRQQMAHHGADDPGELHMTLYYAGDTDGDDQVPDSQIQALRHVAAEVAPLFKPIVAQANGLTRFNGKDQDACVINIDSPELPRFYHEIMTRIDESGEYFRKADHGFTPHVTLGYLDPESPMPFDRYAAHEARFATLELWRGNEIESWGLGHPYQEPDAPAEGEKEDPDDEPAIAVNMHDFKDVFNGDGPGGMPPHRRGARRKRIHHPELIERIHRLQNPREIK